ncbi:hypothetical protein ACGFYQ_29320 [Streptomyces sp. NPDC048258]|uniref:hypothetical protein n=1 Tax=Streptomyces sp. NPDC048258 TaxID=3365527 RepID=UPI003712BD00
MDAEAVTDLAQTEALAAQGHRLFAEGVEGRGSGAEAAGAVAGATSGFGHVANVIRNVGFRSR